jgi:hypothetical protein
MFDVQEFKQYAVSHYDFRATQYDFCRRFYKSTSSPGSAPVLPLHDLSPELRSLIFVGEDNRKFCLINIRERSLNASWAHSFELFLPTIKFLQTQGYVVVDVSHDPKACQPELIKHGVVCYSTSGLTSFENDIRLFSNAHLYVGGGGISHLACLLRVPTIWSSNILINRIPFHIGYSLPCRLSRREDGKILAIDEHILFDILLKENWDWKLDSWSGEFSNDSNLLNLTMELSLTHHVIPPSPAALLYSTVDVLKRIEGDIHSSYSIFPAIEAYGGDAIIPELSPYY